PLIGVALTRQRGTDGVISTGFALTFNLPFLNGARGEVAVARAKRQSLHDIYQQRLDTAVSQVDSLSQQAESLSRMLARLRHSLDALPVIPASALQTVPFQILAADLQQRDSLQQEYARLYETLDRTTIALGTLLGMPLTQSNQLRPDHS
ncbi:MAG: hypothetical protein KGL13_10070, partial [Gammaproteobacteria bacterium]|nr:hypothetical protein [Gammaproteobacteria bacterium]